MPTILTKKPGFTIVELLIVIVVIAILAAVSVVAYSGITNQAKHSAALSDLGQIAKKMEIYKVRNGSYPTGNYQDAFDSINYSASDNVTYEYVTAGREYCLSATDGEVTYVTASTYEAAFKGHCYGAQNLNPEINCPAGFVQVPGDFRYGTKDFCVMKYEAKNNGSNVAVSQAAGTPWVSIDHPGAVAASRTACDNCQLITDKQWMTIAANVLSVASNWSSGTVGSGYIYNGHVNNGPNHSIAASTNDSNGMFGITGGTGNGSQYNNRRTLSLTNGQVIWDLSGNVIEWVDASVTGPQPGPVSGEFVNREYNSTTGWDWRGFNYLDTSLIESTIPGASNFSSVNGIGMISSHPDSTDSFPFFRGGHWSNTSAAGILRLNTNNLASNVSTHIGFRVTSPGV